MMRVNEECVLWGGKLDSQEDQYASNFEGRNCSEGCTVSRFSYAQFYIIVIHQSSSSSPFALRSFKASSKALDASVLGWVSVLDFFAES